MPYIRDGYGPKPWVHHWEERSQTTPSPNVSLGAIFSDSDSTKNLLLVAAGVVAVWAVFLRETNGHTLWDKWTGKRKNPRRRLRRNPSGRQTICSYVGDPDAQLLGEDAMALERLGRGLPVRRASDRLAMLKAYPGMTPEQVRSLSSAKPANAGQVERRGRKPKPKKSRKTRPPAKKSKKKGTSAPPKSKPSDRRKPRNKKGGWKNKTPACRVHLKGDKRKK